MKTERTLLDNRDGWRLELKRYVVEDRFDRATRPVLVVPGYCMNTFILAYHPRGISMVEYLARLGLEVWTVNLRGQGGSERVSGSEKIGFRELSLVDLPRAIDAVLGATATRASSLELIGCSLGGSIIYGYLAHKGRGSPVGGVVAMGAPLRWDEVHPALGLAFRFPALAGSLKISGTRRLARHALPIARRIPGLLDLYMNTRQIDLSRPEVLTQTVDDPIPHINRQIAHWVNQKDLKIDGLNVTAALRGLDIPVMLVIANADGIVPRRAATSAAEAIGTQKVKVLDVGHGESWFAHADLFISDHAERWVFEPLGRWLLGQDR